MNNSLPCFPDFFCFGTFDDELWIWTSWYRTLWQKTTTRRVAPTLDDSRRTHKTVTRKQNKKLDRLGKFCAVVVHCSCCSLRVEFLTSTVPIQHWVLCNGKDLFSVAVHAPCSAHFRSTFPIRCPISFSNKTGSPVTQALAPALRSAEALALG